MKSKQYYWIFVIIVVILVSGCSTVDEKAPEEIENVATLPAEPERLVHDVQRIDADRESSSPIKVPANTEAPQDLALPFGVEDLDLFIDMISPFGLIRHSKDRNFGHGGIDIPLNVGDPIYAVGSGTIIKNKLATDGRGGYDITLYLKEGDREGEAWVFLYEHFELEQNIEVGTKVQKGQLIGKSVINFGSNHMGLIYLFSDLQNSKDNRCWVDHLTAEDKEKFEGEFNKLKTTPKFIRAWNDVNEEGMYPTRGALDKEKYPDGPQLCYPLGTDVRIPI